MQHEITTIITGSLPIFEVRGAIPLAVGAFQFSLTKAFLLGVLGNMLPIIPVLFFLRKFSEFLMHKWYFYNRLMTWVFERTQRKHMDHFHKKKWSWLALYVFVAIPFPLTGAWSGMIAAHILGMRFWLAVGIIFSGIITSGLIISILTSLGVMAIGTMS